MSALPESLTGLRSFTFHLTPYAPGCNGLNVDAAPRNRTMAAEPLRAARSLLKRLMIAPENVRADTDYAGDAEVIRVIDAVPLCLIWLGLTAAEANLLFRHLALSGWRPETTLPLPRPYTAAVESAAA